MLKSVVLIAALLGGFFFPTAAHALRMCAPHDEMIAELQRVYQETLGVIAITLRGALMEITVAANGTFTIILTSPPGISCAIIAGEAWELVPPPAGKKT